MNFIKHNIANKREACLIQKKLKSVSKLRLEVDNVNHEDVIKILVEFKQNGSESIDNIKEAVRAELKLRSEVEIVSQGAIPNDGIVIEDKRTYE